MNNEIKINVPEGMEIDKENSTFECIKFKPKWVPKRGDIAVAGDDYECQIILIANFVRQSGLAGFDIKPLALLSRDGLSIYKENSYISTLWVKREATDLEKKEFIDRLNKEGYVYDPDDPRIIYKKEKELPKSWEDFCALYKIKEKEAYIDEFSKIVCFKNESDRKYCKDRNLLPSKEYAEAMLALCQLIQLRDCYNDGWVPDWRNGKIKYAIASEGNNITKLNYRYENTVLYFKTEELRDTFINNFRDLIEKAKLLL